MGNSVLQSLAKNQDGLMLSESFESVNFASDQGWTTLNGAPTISTATSFDALHSLQMDSSFPQIQRTFSSPYQYSSGYFFDDPTNTTGTFQPFILWQDAFPHVFGIGVNNAISTTKYTLTLNGVQSASTVTRTSGWHKFALWADPVANSVKLYIDGALISTTAAFPLSPTIIKVGAAVYAGTLPFGFFDLIQVMASFFLTINNLPGDAIGSATYTMYDANWNVIAGPSNINGTLQQGFLNSNFPLQAYLRVSFGQDTSMKRILYLSPLLQFSVGDIWAFNQFDLGRRVSMFKKPHMRSSQSLESTSGKDQTLFYFSRDMVSMTMPDLTDDQVQDLLRWFSIAMQGQQFGAAIDSDDVYLGRITATVSNSPVTISVDQTDGLQRGMKLMLINSNGQRVAVLTVKSFTSTTITFSSPVMQGFVAGDILRSSYYWPFAIVTDQSLDPMLKNPKLKRWDVVLNFKEAL